LQEKELLCVRSDQSETRSQAIIEKHIKIECGGDVGEEEECEDNKIDRK
jgi:hypothetical protein